MVLLVLLMLLFSITYAQQPYINNKQNDCYDNSDNFTEGYYCNGASTTCKSYLAFRSNPPRFDTASAVAAFLRTDASSIAQYNHISDSNASIPSDTILLVPISSCSCSSGYYQYNSSYVLQSSSETYFTVANDTFQGLTTCQALLYQNPQYDSYSLHAGMNLTVPLRCACPTSEQIANGVKYLLTYLVSWGDDSESIARMFSIDAQLLLVANNLTSTSLLFPFTPLLIPLAAPPEIKGIFPPPPTPPPPTPPPPAGDLEHLADEYFEELDIQKSALSGRRY